MSALAQGFARFGTGQALSPAHRGAAARIRSAVAAHPLMVGGAGRFDTEAMTILGARVFIKSGAEGVLCAALPEAGLGLAVKADDGAGRAAQVMIVALIKRLGISTARRSRGSCLSPRCGSSIGMAQRSGSCVLRVRWRDPTRPLA